MARHSLSEVPPNRRILLVDDTAAIHNDYRKILGGATPATESLLDARAALFDEPIEAPRPVAARFEFDSAYQGQEALHMVRRALRDGRPYAMAFVDVRMPPGWDGIETIRHIWAEYPELQVVICSAYSDYSWDDIVRQIGQSDRLLILKKPFDSAEVQQLVCALTEKWRLERQARLQMDDLERMVELRTRELKSAHEQLNQSQKMEAVGRLAGGVAHDFNNLLTGILGYGEIALENVESGSQVADCLEEIRRSGKRAAALTSQLLSFSRKQLLEIAEVELNSLIVDMDGLLRCSINAGIRLVADLAPDLRLVKADAMRLEQVILNLAVNARDAMPAAGELTIRTANVEVDAAGARELANIIPGPYVVLSVADTGCGMDEFTRSHIFEPFFTTKPRGKGTGMGLPTVYGIVKQSDGHITFDSAPGEGTTFKIYLPASISPRAEKLVAVEPVSGCDGSETILLTEDEQAVRGLACRALRKNGYTVLDASSGAEALKLSNDYPLPIDLLVTDVIMPGMSGPELAKDLVGQRDELRVLFISGYTADELSTHGIAEESMHLLTKPFSQSELSRKVRQILDGPALETTWKSPVATHFMNIGAVP